MSDELFEIRANLELLNEIIERRMIELIQAIDDLRRSLEERQTTTPISGGVSWNDYELYG
tara:strand:+ start:966 stop:1145 length:180 start_codon:yes stop_codon:yes gene_type:complete